MNLFGKMNQLPQPYPDPMPSPIERTTSDQPIVGLRVWKLIDDRGLPKLRSVYKETVWPYRKALERDVLNDMGIHAVKPGIRQGSPSVADPAGIYGMDVLGLFASYEADVAGEVYLWGRVDEHTEGYLADFAYPKKLYPHADLDPVIAMQLEDEYGVPVEYRPEFTKKPKSLPDGQVYPKGLMTTASGTYASLSGMQQAIYAQQQIQYYSQLQQAQQNAMSNAALFGTGPSLMGLGWKP